MKRLPWDVRFWSNVRTVGTCWEWQGELGPYLPYGRFSFSKKKYSSHRVSWEMLNGSIPSGMLVCHKCDNPKCVRPDHLFLGTHSDNSRDMTSKGRAWAQQPQHRAKLFGRRVARGEQCGQSVLTDSAVMEIRKRLSAGERQAPLAREFGISTGLIHLVAKGVIWRHVQP